MVKVTMKEADLPSAQVVAHSVAEVSVVDASGRSITLKKPGVLAQFKLVEMLGDSAQNAAYVGMVLPLIYVTAIDGETIPRITTKLGLEGLIQRLDEDGVMAVATGVMEHFGKQNPEKDAAAVKN